MTPIDPITWSRLEPLLDALLDATPADRTGILRDLLATDPGLHALVEPLMNAAQRQDGFLDAPLEEFARPMLPLIALDVPEIADQSLPSGEWTGSYRVIRKLGEGGMGVVYEAEQRDPRRTVALKVIREGRFAGERTIRAFRREISLLARLKHPSIAAILEAGETADGLHYFAMEYVHGVTLDAYLGGRRDVVPRDRAEIRHRLELFLSIAEAIAYAHQHGVMHLDLKPQNILVEGDPQGTSVASVKILDFGLARLFETTGDVSAQLTRTTGFFGTLPYMSPEQVAGGGDDVDIRADVYGLGVILHEMLTGRRPLALEGLPFHEALRVISEESPSRPGLAMPLLRGDLETITMKTLAKDPTARYAGVPALIDDIRRYLAHLPIFARPPGTVYQLRMMVRRNRVGFGFAAALAAVIVLGSIGTLVGMIRARHQEARARDEAAVSAQISEFLESLFKIADPDIAQGNQVSARDLLDEGARKIRTGLSGQPPRVRARLLLTMGNAYRNLGLYDDAAPLLEEALAAHRAALGPDHLDVATNEIALGGLLRKQGKFAEVRPHYENALRIRRAVLGPAHATVASSVMTLANLESELGEYPTARTHYEEALAIAEKARGADHPDVALFLTNLGLVCWRMRDLDAARPLLERALAIHEKSGGSESMIADDHQILGMILTSSRDYPAAESHLVQALRIQEKVFGPEHPDVAATCVSLGTLRRAAGDLPGARAELERAITIMEKRLGPEHPVLAATMDNLANVLTDLGEMRDVEKLRTRSLAISERSLGPDHPELALTLVNLAGYYRKVNDPRRALPIYERALGICDRGFGPAHEATIECLHGIADTAARAGAPARAEEARRRLAAIEGPSGRAP